MPDYDDMNNIRDFESLVEYLRDELNWPFEEDLEIEDLAFDYEPEELGLDKEYEVAINEIKQIRPASGKLPWGIFYVDFEKKRLPVVVLRRALRALVPKKRATANAAYRTTWDADDLLFIAATGDAGNRGISFVHFEKAEEGQPRLKTIAWDEQETHFFYLKQDISRLSWPDDEDDATAWRKKWAGAFTTEHREVIRTSKELSSELARLARSTRDLIRDVYDYEAKDGALHKLHESFRTVLIEDLDLDGFADMVAQTISYGLFSARATGEPVLGLAHLEAMVPNTNPFLKELFAEFVSMSGTEKHQIDFDELGVSDLVAMLNNVKVEAVLQDFGRQTGGGTEDPVIYFYEDFLKDYDKDQKVKRGEFYTPKPVVSYIVRSVDRVLRDELDCPDGLADTSTMEWNGETWPKVMILDPATGTGTFLETVIEVIYETMTEKWRGQGKKQDQMHAAWNEYVPEHLLPRLHGFELMMAPYSVAHMKLGLKLKETGYEFESDERLRVYLTNTLEEPQDFSGRLYADFLAHEAEAANRIKKDVPVTVMIGNPPWAGHAATENPWINSLLRNELTDGADGYFRVDGQPLGERNPKWLNDDYVKFIRYGQYRISATDFGLLAYITNHGYLDNPTFRGMRQSLMSTFVDIKVLDLHGNVKKKEITPKGEIDDNVFDIQQGASIGLFTRKPETFANERFVDHADLWGKEQDKYKWLSEEDVSSTEWAELLPTSPAYLFALYDVELLIEYEQGRHPFEMMPTNVMGFQTHRDHFAIAFDHQNLRTRIEDLRRTAKSDEELREKYRLKDNKDFQLAATRKQVREEKRWKKYFVDCQYRPFDVRPSYYSSLVMDRPRKELLNHVAGSENLCLGLGRQGLAVNDPQWALVSASTDPLDANMFRRGGINVFPLYLYPGDNLFDAGKVAREANLAPEFVEELSSTLGLCFLTDGQGDLEATFGPENVFHYAYAVFHSPRYRERYAEFLKRDFPRLPLTSDLDLFSELCELGEQLVALHLMNSSLLDDPFTTFPKRGSNLMEKAKHDPEENRVYINKEGQYFNNVPEETWNFRVGGYQVLDKWLKDRKGRTLSEEDIEHYTKVVKALHETARIMREIDEVIEAHGGWPLAGSVREVEKQES